MLARVSHLEAFRYWREAEDQSVDDLIERLTTFQPTEPMLAGTAFHKALELSTPGEYDTLYANGYTFHMPEAEFGLPQIRELRTFSRYGDLTVTGQVDSLDGRVIHDHKTTGRFDPERYLAGYPWRLYLDLFDAEIFRWNVFEIRELKPKVYEVDAPQILETWRYPGLHDDCARLAADFHMFAKRHLPSFNAITEAA